MTKSIYPPGWVPVDEIRKRPGMFVGSFGFFGFVHYLVCPFALLLAHRPRRIDVTVNDAGFVIDSDAAISIEETEGGRIGIFESLEGPGNGHHYEGCILNALSESLVVRASDSGSTHMLEYRRGQRLSHEIERQHPGPSTRLSFSPDTSIFTITNLSPAIFESYLRRMSFLHRGVRFRMSYEDQTREYLAEGGIRDLFDSVTAPYQLLHAPIAIEASEGDLRLELVFAYHSWVENAIWCFVNNGRAVEGGTHEKGLEAAFSELHAKLKLRRTFQDQRNGVIALMSIIYPGAVWEGCIKARIGNPELFEIIPRLVVAGVMDWVGRHPEVAEQLTRIQPFQFPDVWSR